MAAEHKPGNLYYLTVMFPNRSGLYAELVERLNKSIDDGLFQRENGGYYNWNTINSIVRATVKDYDNRVKLEMLKILAEIEERKNNVDKYIEAAEKALGVLHADFEMHV